MPKAVAAPTKHTKSADRAMSLASAKAHFSEVVTSVEQRRQPVTILRRGQPVAQIVPMQVDVPSLYGSMRGTVVELGDIVGPTSEEWTVGEE